VTAEDADSGAHGHVTYSLLLDHSTQEPFHMDAQTGVLTTTQPLDRETQSVHYLTVVASDLAVPPLSSTVTVGIMVVDDNDNSPEFFPVTRANNTFYVSTAVARGYVITRLRAVDRDAGQNAHVTYELYTDQVCIQETSILPVSIKPISDNL